MKVKVGSVILGFVMICIGIAALAGQTPVFGIHPIVWFILGVMLICSDSAWEKLAHAKRHDHQSKDSSAEDAGESAEGKATGTKADTASAAGKTTITGTAAVVDGPANDAPHENAVPTNDDREASSNDSAADKEAR